MKLRFREIDYLEVTGLGILSCIKIYIFLFRKFIKKDVRDGNGAVIIRERGGGYQGFVSPGDLKRAKGRLKKAIRNRRVLMGDNIEEEVKIFFSEEYKLPVYCPVFEKERFLGLAYFDLAKDILAEELQIVLKHNEWDKKFWEDKILLSGKEKDIAEGLSGISKVFSVPMITNEKELKKYYGKIVIGEKSFREINTYVRNTDLQSALNVLKEVEVSVVLCRIPEIEEIENLTEDEQLRNKLSISGAYVERPEQNITEQLQKVYGENYPLWEKGEIACIRQYYAPEQGIYKLVDRKGEKTNVIDGKRKTTGVPDVWQNSVYIIGPCTVQGSYVQDEYTIPSYIQKYFNKYYPNKYRVVNLGTGGFYEGDYENISKMNLKKADIVVFVNYFQKDEIIIPQKVKYVELIKSFAGRDKECFFDLPKHVNAEGGRRIAKTIWEDALEEIIDKLEKQYKTEGDRNELVKKADYSRCINRETELFVQKLQKDKFAAESDNIGAIVMNCNPFTSGHRYLIETASRQVQFLYVFVVEEDRSYFLFQDRMNMVKKGVSDLKNVRVLSSGRYVLSASTMPEYFTKETQQDIVVCASDDLEIFGMYIAPALGITKRFVGEEPFDKVTDQYNKSMERVLPEYGIELICIKRKEDEENKVISASKVRKLIREKRYEDVKKIVPESTFTYLKEELHILS